MSKAYTIVDLPNGGVAITAKFNTQWKQLAESHNGKWDPKQKAWVFGPRQKIKVLPLLDTIDWEAKQEPPPKRPWIPCGYPGCQPGLCDDCDGEGAKYDYRGRRIN